MTDFQQRQWLRYRFIVWGVWSGIRPWEKRQHDMYMALREMNS